ncbi:hypothetical protein [Methanocaldococcus sp.]
MAIVRETETSYIVKSNKKTVYVCKRCGATFENAKSLSAHLKSKNCPKIPEEEIKKKVEEIKNNLEEEEKTEEMKSVEMDPFLKEMVDRVREFLLSNINVQQVKDYQFAVESFIQNYFVKLQLWKDHVKLIKILKKMFPKMTDYDFEILISIINEIIEKYTPDDSVVVYSPEKNNSGDIDMNKLALETFNKLFDAFLKHIEELPKKTASNQSNVDPKLLEQLADLKAEKAKYEVLVELLKAQNEELKNRLDRLENMIVEMSKSQPKVASSDQWSDDYARLAKELIDKVTMIYLEGKKTRMMLLQTLLPHLLNKRSEKITALYGTSEDLLKELEEEDDEE